MALQIGQGVGLPSNLYLTPPGQPAAGNLFAGANSGLGGALHGQGAQTPTYGAQPPTSGQAVGSNYLGFVNSQPNVLAALQALNTQGADSNTQTRALIQNLIANFGSPQIAQQLGLAVDPATAALAGSLTQSGDSTLGRLNLAAAQAKGTMLNTLAGSGLAHSGLLGASLNQQNATNSQNLYDAGQTLQNSVGQANTTNLNTQTQLNNNLYNAYIKANSQYGSQFSKPGATGIAAPTAPKLPTNTGTTTSAPSTVPVSPPRAPVIKAAPIGRAGGIQ